MLRHAQAAIDAFQQREMPCWLAVTRLELGEWRTQRGDADAGEKLLVQARSAFVELGAIPWLERVDEVVQGSDAATAGAALPA